MNILDYFQIFRHGDRTPDQDVIYKNDPYRNETYYPFGYGQLTNVSINKYVTLIIKYFFT